MEGVHPDAQMERVFARGLGHVLVGADACGFKGFGRQLLVLVRDEMAAERELVHRVYIFLLETYFL